MDGPTSRHLFSKCYLGCLLLQDAQHPRVPSEAPCAPNLPLGELWEGHSLLKPTLPGASTLHPSPATPVSPS
jgi:hypothetical protein